MNLITSQHSYLGQKPLQNTRACTLVLSLEMGLQLLEKFIGSARTKLLIHLSSKKHKYFSLAIVSVSDMCQTLGHCETCWTHMVHS